MGLIHVVDDEDIIRELVGETLRRLGHEVHLHATPSSLFDDAALGEGDVIVTDMLLPQMDGFKLMQRLRAAPRTQRTPIVAMTALKWGQGLEERLKQQFAVEHVLQKPLRKEELIAAVAHYAKPTAPNEPSPEPVAPREHEILFIGFNPQEARMLAASLDYLARATIGVALPEDAQQVSRALAERSVVPTVALIDEQTPVAIIAEVAAWAKRTGARAALVLQAMPFLRDVLSKDLGLAFIEAYQVTKHVSELLAISARKDPRVPLTGPARLWMQARQIDGRLLDLSVSGARLAADYGVESGALVQMGFALPAPVATSFDAVDARVRWVRRADSGVLVGASFEKLVVEQERALEQFVASRKRAVS